jgi:phosphate:Na+ symporter
MGLLGGLAIFLFGMEQMTDALKAVAGVGMSKVLARLTRNRFTAAFTGAFVTAVIQSSSVTTVLVVGFISAGLMTLQQSIGVIMGANVGTTITAQIIAFKVTHYALILVAVGFGMLFVSKRERIRQYGGAMMGLGFVFFGMGLMSEATNPLRTYQPFIDLMGRMSNPLLGITVAAVFTALVQSSSATTGVVIVLASQGFITLEAGIALAFGANIGTCVTAILAALGKPTAAKQAAAVHLAFNILGVLVWVPLIGMLASVVAAISPAHAGLEDTACLAAETPRQIANAHTIFNVANTFIFLGFTTPLARLIQRLIPEKPGVVPAAAKPKFLDETFLEAPSLALDRIRLEAVRLGQFIAELFAEARNTMISGDAADLDAIVARERDLQMLQQAITDYGRRISSMGMTSAETRRQGVLNTVTSNVQHVGETIAINFVAIGRERLERQLTFSEETIRRFRPYGTKVREAFDLALQALAEKDVDLARQVMAMKPEIQRLADETAEHLGRRLVADDPNRAVLYRVENQMVELLQRVYYFAKRIAKEILRAAEVEEEVPVGTGQEAA